uniref:Uncharacterized protein n=1 Tax=Rhizophora mucronata TaxID=61149 RepID=A0A2P2P9I2_RHIMU
MITINNKMSQGSTIYLC